MWVCSNNLENKGEATAAMSFDLKIRRSERNLSVCPAMARSATTSLPRPMARLISPTRARAALLCSSPGAGLEIAAKDPLLAGADGLAFGEKTILYVNSVSAVNCCAWIWARMANRRALIELKLSRPLDRPDGMRAIGKNRLLLAENSGKMSIVTFEGDRPCKRRDQDH